MPYVRVRLTAFLKVSVVWALSATVFAACGGVGPPILSGVGGSASSRATSSETFGFTGQPQNFTVPEGVTQLKIKAEGAGTSLARGGLVVATIAVQPEESLAIIVGGAPNGMNGGYNGGGAGGDCDDGDPSCPLIGEGGAGSSDVREGGSSLNDRVIVAAGAGGKGGPGQYHGGRGGAGGGHIGGRAGNGKSVFVSSLNGTAGGGGGGTGGAQDQGGVGGAGGTVNGSHEYIVPGVPGGNGAVAAGGAGGTTAQGYDFAGGCGGGGGGGYYGGGGGGSGANGSEPPGGFSKGVGSGGGGGGGSSFVQQSAKSVTIKKGKGSNANGVIVVSW
jgi:hypothetical protein